MFDDFSGETWETNYHHSHRSRFDAYAPYIKQRWESGCHTIQQIWREIQAMGYPHSDRALRSHLEPLRGKVNGRNANLFQKVEQQDIQWYLAGSAALAARGLDVAPRDLDLIADDAGAHSLGDLLFDTLIHPVEDARGWISNWFGRAFFHRIC